MSDEIDMESYDQNQHVIDQEVELSSALPEIPLSMKFRGARVRTHKWGKIIMIVGYVLVFINALALLLTTMKVTKIIDERALHKETNPFRE